MLDKYTVEFETIIKPILSNEEFLKTKEKRHHGITRFDHLMRVSYYSFLITKILHLNYKETTRAALLHDFFLDETNKDTKIGKLRNHPYYALENSLKLFDLNNKEKDIILKHMWPVTIIPPKYLEGFVITFVDKHCAMSETFNSFAQICSKKTVFRYAYVFLCLLFIRF